MPLPPLIAAFSTHFAEFRLVLLPLLAGAAAIYFLLPRPQGRQIFVGAVLGILALAMAGVLIVNVGGVRTETLLFYTFSGLAVIAGTLLVTQHNPARAALSFTLVILSVTGIFLLLAAPFLMGATIIVYAGAIVVTFLFILMLAAQTGLTDADIRSREPLLASLTGFVLLGALIYVLQLGYQRGVKDLDPFLNRIRAAAAKGTAEEIDKELQGNPDELDRALERMRQEVTDKKRLDELGPIPSNADFGTHLRMALELVGLTDLRKRTENEAALYAWPAPTAPDAAKTMQSSLANYETLVLAARNRIGLVQPDAGEGKYQSGFSGAPSAVTANLRRDRFGRPEAPAENSAHLGKSLFTDYLLPVELGGFLLLIATVGAIVIAHRQKPTGRAS